MTAKEQATQHLHRLTHELQDRLPMWVIYNQQTRDYPGFWIARMHMTLPQPEPTNFVMVEPTLEALHARLPPWLTRLERSANDEPQIVEVWL